MKWTQADRQRFINRYAIPPEKASQLLLLADNHFGHIQTRYTNFFDIYRKRGKTPVRLTASAFLDKLIAYDIEKQKAVKRDNRRSQFMNAYCRERNLTPQAIGFTIREILKAMAQVKRGEKMKTESKLLEAEQIVDERFRREDENRERQNFRDRVKARIEQKRLDKTL